MLWPHFILSWIQHPLRQAGCIRAIRCQVSQQVIVYAAVTVKPVLDGADQFFLFATSIDSPQARMICAATVGISSS